MTSPADPQAGGNPMTGWAPIRWSWNDGAPVVDWCELGDLRLTAPFFAETIHDAQKRGGAVRRTPADVLTSLPETGPGARPAGLIFHLSRCGSTLATQALAALPENIVLSEPETMDEVLWAGQTCPTVTPEVCGRELRGLARAYGWRRFPPEERFFIKFDTWHTLHFARIRKAFPGVPWIFLYRDPVEVLVSQLTLVSGRMLPGPMTAAYLGLPLMEALPMPLEEFCARALGRIAEAGIEAMAQDPGGGLLVNYAQLPEALETVIAPWFGVDLSPADRERMRQTAGFHSKSPERAFVADGAAKQRLATEEVRRLADRWVGAAYARLQRGLHRVSGSQGVGSPTRQARL